LSEVDGGPKRTREEGGNFGAKDGV
jgi:hypothetical protein